MKPLPWSCKGIIMLSFILSFSLCQPAALVLILAILGGPAVYTMPPPPSLIRLLLIYTMMSSSEHNLCVPVSSWESPTSKPRIRIIKLLFLAFPLHVTDPTLWSSLSLSHPPAFSLSLWTLSYDLSYICPSLLLSADCWFVQEAAADSEPGGESWPGRLLLITSGHQQGIINNGNFKKWL